MFKSNDKIFYPGHGVAVVERIDKKHIAGVQVIFYRLAFLQRALSIIIPLSHLKTIEARYLSDRNTIETIFRELGSQNLTPSNFLLGKGPDS